MGLVSYDIAVVLQSSHIGCSAGCGTPVPVAAAHDIVSTQLSGHEDFFCVVCAGGCYGQHRDELQKHSIFMVGSLIYQMRNGGVYEVNEQHPYRPAIKIETEGPTEDLTECICASWELFSQGCPSARGESCRSR